MKALTLTSPLKAVCAAGLASLLLSAAASGAVLTENFNLGGTSQNSTVWTDLSNANDGFAPDAGSAPGTLTTTGGAFAASFGLYSFTTDYTVAVTQGASYDIQNVVFQLELSPNPDFTFPYSGGPLLSINGGQYLLAADSFLTGQTEARNTFGATPLNYVDAVWQWNLSGVTATINSISVLTPISVHTSTVGARLDTSNAFGGFVTPVPEPSSAILLSFLGLGAVIRRRR